MTATTVAGTPINIATRLDISPIDIFVVAACPVDVASTPEPVSTTSLATALMYQTIIQHLRLTEADNSYTAHHEHSLIIVHIGGEHAGIA
jgi:hypothetical protein